MLTMDQQRGLGIFSISISLLIALTGLPDLITAANVTANCSTEFDDLASKSATAAVVLHGKALYSPLPLSNSTDQSIWTATFQVQTTYKGLLNVSIDPKQTGSSSAKRKSVVTIGMSIPEADFTGCAGETSIRPGDGYFLFLNGSYTDREESSEVGRIYWISSLPEMFSKTLTRTVKDHCCDNCTHRPQIKPMAPLMTVEENNRISIRCQTTGRPSPQITWYRDGQRLSPSKDILFATSKNSRLVIKHVKLEDFGMYWCQAVNVFGVTNSTVVNVTREPGKHHAVLCERQVYCLNHGTCYKIITLDHKFCECTVNYTGHRCQDRYSPEFGFDLDGFKPDSMDSYRVAMAGLFLATLIFIVLCVIAYCLAQMRYDNRSQIRQQLVTFTASDQVDTVRPNGDISNPLLTFHRDKILYAQKTGSERGESEDNVRKRLPEVLVQLIESDSDRSPGGRDKELQRDIVTVALPTENTLSVGSQRQRLAAISTTPASASPTDLFHVQLQQPVTSNGCDKEEKVVPDDSSQQQVVVENCAPPVQHRGSTEVVTDHVGSRLSKSSNNDKNNRNYQKILADGLVMQHSQSQPF